MAKTTGGVRGSNSAQNRRRVANSNQFSQFADIVRSSSSFEQALSRVRGIQVNDRTSALFRQVFSEDINTSPEQAFRNFFNAVRR